MQYADFTASAGSAIDRLPRGGVEELTYRDQGVVARVRRLRLFRESDDEDIAEMEPLTMADVRRTSFDIIQAVREGRRIVIGRKGRREAVIEGVRA